MKKQKEKITKKRFAQKQVNSSTEKNNTNNTEKQKKFFNISKNFLIWIVIILLGIIALYFISSPDYKIGNLLSDNSSSGKSFLSTTWNTCMEILSTSWAQIETQTQTPSFPIHSIPTPQTQSTPKKDKKQSKEKKQSNTDKKDSKTNKLPEYVFSGGDPLTIPLHDYDLRGILRHEIPDWMLKFRYTRKQIIERITARREAEKKHSQLVQQQAKDYQSGKIPVAIERTEAEYKAHEQEIQTLLRNVKDKAESGELKIYSKEQLKVHDGKNDLPILISIRGLVKELLHYSLLNQYLT